MTDTSAAQKADPSGFISRWRESGASERANYQLFLSELCDILGVPHPNPSGTDVSKNTYVFERDVKFQNSDGTTSDGRIDLYKQGCFVLEAKQGTAAQDSDAEPSLLSKAKRLKKGHGVRGSKGWDDAMVRARGQAEMYAKALPTKEGWPPFLIVVDVGHSIELYADFTRSGKTYLQYPDPKSFRILLRDLENQDLRNLLQKVWTDPLSLDPTRRSAKVTRELADRLAKLAKSLEKSDFDPKRVAQFLMRCLFTMFAEDVDLIPRASFSELLKSLREDVSNFPDMVRSLWESMDKGQFHPVLRKKLRRFNGGLFEDCEALPLNADQLDLLIEASQADWRDVEPAIFGTLLERALDSRERHKLGAHYTPRAYVERLVLPTIVEPLRADWDAVKAAAYTEAKRGNIAEADKIVRDFLAHLCNTRVLDPACGSGNFLYVSLEHMKRLEGEVLDLLRELNYGQSHREIFTVDPHQFLGIEVNPRAAAIADLVLWIGYLQWHTRTRKVDEIVEPIIRKFHNVECRDAVLAWDRVEEVRDEKGNPVTRWDGHTTKKHQVTGEDIPDDTARVPVLKYINPRKADWPQAEFIVGNPPFIGNWRMRQVLGDGYAECIRSTYSTVPEACDYVMYWWDRAAEQVAAQKSRQLGLITTNSLRQTFSRRVLEPYLKEAGPLSLNFAIPDHPWVDSSDGAAVRIAMTVASHGVHFGQLLRVMKEVESNDDSVYVEFEKCAGRIQCDLRIGAEISGAIQLQANRDLSNRGFCLFGAGFILTTQEAVSLGYRSDNKLAEVIHPYRNGRDINQSSRNAFVIDLCELNAERARIEYPTVYQWVHDYVKPERDQNKRKSRRDNWWIYGEPNPKLRSQLRGLKRYIATVETSKHRTFIFLDAKIHPDNMLVAIASEDAALLACLSSRIHVVWALAAGGRLGVGNDPRYNKTRCFEPFPFPVTNPKHQTRIRDLAEQLDAHRKKQQALHPDLTLTGMYNVLGKLRSGEPLTAKEKIIHEQGLVSVLKQIHDDLDAAVFEAYGWPVTLTDEEILERLVALNAQRAQEEANGLIRWLRPEFQNPPSETKVQKKIAIKDDEDEAPKAKPKKAKSAKPSKKLPWPKKLSDQAQVIVQQLQAAPKPVTLTELAKSFTRANVDQLTEILDTLVSLGKARELKSGKFTAA